MKKLVSVTALTGLSFLSAVTIAAETADEIIVTATRTEGSGIPIPASISVVNRLEIEASGARNLADLLRSRAGVHVSDLYGDGSGASLDMRGFGATAVSNTLVLVDGRPLNNASDIAVIDLSLIDLDNVERVEIVQGSAGTLYGNQAVGGLINVITRGAPDRPTARIGADMASFDEQRISANAGHRFENGFAFTLRGRHREGDNYRDHNRSRLDHAGLRLEQNFRRGLAFLEHDYSEEDVQMPGALFKDEMDADRRQSVATYANDYSLTQTQATRFGFAVGVSENWRLEGEATERENDREFVTSFRAFAGTLSTQRRRVATANPRLHGTAACGTGQCQFTVGADLEQTRYRLLTSFGPQNVDQSITSYYGQAVLPLGSAFAATVGARHAAVTNDIYTGTTTQLDDDVTVGSAGLSWKPHLDWRVFARADQNFRFAKVDEHTNPVFGQPVGLKNQTGISYETGLEFTRGNRLAKAVFYELILDDEISFDTTGYSNVNLTQTRRYGLMLESAWPISSSWSLSGAYTWTDGKITDGPNDGMRIPLVPRSQARLAAEWHLAMEWWLRAEGHWVGDQINGGDFANAFPELPSYGVANLRLRYRRGDLELGFQVNNLFDHEYSETGAIGQDATFTSRDAFYPAPGRNLRLTMGYTWH